MVKKIGNNGVWEGDTYFLKGMEGFIYDKSPRPPRRTGQAPSDLGPEWGFTFMTPGKARGKK
jgi:hypothetical protein